jgi:GNAT superfamily N-acetyltransferase
MVLGATEMASIRADERKPSRRRGPSAIRAFEHGDIEFGERVRAVAGWNQTASDWEFFLESRPNGAFLATLDGEPAGTAMTIEYGERIGWIGMVLVDPRFRRLGIGTALVERCVESFPPGCIVGLDATPAGREVYANMGFDDTTTLSRLVLRRTPAERTTSRFVTERGSGSASTPSRDGILTDAVLAELRTLDRAAFGVDRGFLLDAWIRRAPHSVALRFDETGKLSAFALGRAGSNYAQIGPVVARCEREGAALVEEIVADGPCVDLVIDVFDVATGLRDSLEVAGFRRERGFTRMTRGGRLPEDRSGIVLAAAGPEFG